MTRSLLEKAGAGSRLSDEDCLRFSDSADLLVLMRAAAALRDEGHGRTVSYSRKVFIPLTRLCRDSCHYCTFAIPPRRGERAFMSLDEVTAVAQAGVSAGCKEALFTLGDKPELRYRAAREELAAMGYESTIAYLRAAAQAALDVGLLPHLNPGTMTAEEVALLRPVSVSMGLMLESAATRLCEKGGPHHGSPDKDPAIRLATIEAAGRAAVPFTTGILIGIGETRRERIEALLALRALHESHGHIQEIIIQNFRAKLGTRMDRFPDASETELLWTAAVARLVFGAEANIQAPPNLSPQAIENLVEAGINDWGGISPVTPDHVNPERPWPDLEILAGRMSAVGKELTERLALYPRFARNPRAWVAPPLVKPVLDRVDASGLARTESWRAGISAGVPRLPMCAASSDALEGILVRAQRGEGLNEAEVTMLFGARGGAAAEIYAAADELRAATVGSTVSYVVNRNINYTNVCSYKCQFCAFSKGKLSENLRGAPYELDSSEIERRVEEAWQRGATEVCMQGGIHPSYTGETYLSILRSTKSAAPEIHVHAFSPLEVLHGATTLDLTPERFLARLRDGGLATLPGTAAEILDDEIRAVLCPDKLSTAEWLAVMEAAHRVGLRSTATIMYGHVERPVHWARHLLAIRRLQERTGGFTEFVPLPFVADEAPIYLKGRARPGPTYQEAILMHAVARLVLNPVITHIQASWVKMGRAGVADCLRAGADDLGGTLMNESISRAAGASHGQELAPSEMEQLIRESGRSPRQRTTLYGDVPREARVRSFAAAPLSPTRVSAFGRARQRRPSQAASRA
jgi:FO synthase